MPQNPHTQTGGGHSLFFNVEYTTIGHQSHRDDTSMGKQTDNYLALKRKCVPANQKESPKAFTLTFAPHMSLATFKQKSQNIFSHRQFHPQPDPIFCRSPQCQYIPRMVLASSHSPPQKIASNFNCLWQLELDSPYTIYTAEHIPFGRPGYPSCPGPSNGALGSQ